MTIFTKQYEEIEIGVREDFLNRLDLTLRRRQPQTIASIPQSELKRRLNQSINRAASFGFCHELEVERFVALDLHLGSSSARFYARQDVRALSSDRLHPPAERVSRLETLAKARPLR